MTRPLPTRRFTDVQDSTLLTRVMPRPEPEKDRHARCAPGTLALALLFSPALVWAQAATDAAARPSPPTQAVSDKEGSPQKLERVELKGGPSDDSLRRNASAAKIVISREEIERFGDASVGEVLKRLPGVTVGGRPGRGGDIRMRGMGGGYTQILVNGERMPPGFSLDQLPPEQVERIEVIRAPTAEFGARAVAGTINVVLREALQKRLHELRLMAATEKGLFSPSVQWSRNDKLGDSGMAYNINLGLQRNDSRDDIERLSLSRDLATPNLVSEEREQGQSRSRRESVQLGGRLQWKASGADQFTLQAFATANQVDSSSQSRLQPARPYDEAQTQADNRFQMLRSNLQWQRRIDADTRLDLRLGLNRAHGSGHSERDERLMGQDWRQQADKTSSQDRGHSLNGKLSRQLESDHSLMFGAEWDANRRDSERSCEEWRPALGTARQTCRATAEFGDNTAAKTERWAIYGQDEWTLNKQWSFYAGLRGESILTQSTASSYRTSNRSTVWTPLLHGVWKPNPGSRDQVRMSLTRSYKSPNLNDLTAPLSINAQAPCPAVGLCGPNEMNQADRMGNPDLRPELATGVELAYERYLSKGGVLSANVFARRIKDLIRNVSALESVSWASVPRWVSRPRNVGEAWTAGLELEAKFRLDEWFSDLPAVQLRSNLSVFESRVDSLPGPDARLEGQPRGTANLGADYRLRSLPLSLGASLNYTPVTRIQQSEIQRSSSSQKQILDGFVAWHVDPNTLLRLSATNLAPLDYHNSSVFNDGRRLIETDSGGRTYTLWQLRLEMKL